MKRQCDATCIDLVSGDEDPETCTKSSKVVVKTTTRKRHLGHGWSQRGTKSSRKQARAHHKRKKNTTNTAGSSKRSCRGKRICKLGHGWSRSGTKSSHRHVRAHNKRKTSVDNTTAECSKKSHIDQHVHHATLLTNKVLRKRNQQLEAHNLALLGKNIQLAERIAKLTHSQCEKTKRNEINLLSKSGDDSRVVYEYSRGLTTTLEFPGAVDVARRFLANRELYKRMHLLLCT